jgi:hypothetical protein
MDRIMRLTDDNGEINFVTIAAGKFHEWKHARLSASNCPFFCARSAAICALMSTRSSTPPGGSAV